MAPVVLKTELQCSGCAMKIYKSIRTMLGVREVWASPERGLVVVAGTADAEVLRSKIEELTQRPVAIISDGKRPSQYAWGTTLLSRRRLGYPPALPYGGYPYGGGFPAWRPHDHYAPSPPPLPMLHRNYAPPPPEDYPAYSPYAGGYPPACCCEADDYYY